MSIDWFSPAQCFGYLAFVLGVVVVVNIALGLALAKQPSDWLPLVASCLGTIALFLLQGIPNRRSAQA